MPEREQQIKIIPLSKRIQVSVVIPFFYAEREQNLEGLLSDLRKQTFVDMEIIIVSGVSPQGKAINQGVRVSQGEILVTIDDDSRLGHPEVIENLVRTIRENSNIGMAGASVVIPENANGFQREASKQFPRFNMAVVKEVTDSDLPGHPCAALPKDVFIQIGMERENILRGLDPDLRVRIRQAGYRIVLVPDTWINHPLPDSFFKFMRVFFRNGYGSAYTQRVHPEINYDTDESTSAECFVPKRPFLYRLVRFPLRLAKSLLTLQWIRFLGYMVYIVGYAQAYIQFSFQKPQHQKKA